MWPWAVRWPPVRVSVPAQRARHCGPAGRPATTRTSSPNGWGTTWSTSPTPVRRRPTCCASRQHGAPPQVDALDGSEHLVTVTIGGNDVGYVPLLFAATAPPLLRALPVIGNALRELLDPAAREGALATIGASLREVGQAVRTRAPQARIMFVDYLTLLPPAGTPAPPLPDDVADLASPCRRPAGRHHRRGGAGHRLRGGAGRAGQPRPPRLVGRSVDGGRRIAAAVAAETVPPQRRRYASGRGSGRRGGGR